MLNRKIQPPITDAVDFELKLKKCEHYTLNNKVPVYSLDAGIQEVVMIEWVFYAGNWYEQQNIVAATTNFLLKNGTKQKSAYQINEHFEFYGAYLNRSCYNETATITLHCLSKHVGVLLPVVAELITESIFPESELSIYKQNQKQRLEVNLKKCDFIANRLIDEYIYGIYHPYGKYTSTLDYDAIERSALAQFFQKFYTEGKCIIFAAGKLPADLDKQFENHFGSLPLQQRSIPNIQYNIQAAENKKYRIINDPDGVQGAIRLARPFPNRHHPDFQKAHILNNIFGGFFGSRLMSNIREDKGYTYGIHSFIQNHIKETSWMISTEAGRDVCEATIDEVYKEMKKLCVEPIDEEELHLVRNHMIGGILGDLDGPFQLIARWKNYILNGIDENYFYNSIQHIKTTTAEELRELAQKYLQPEAFYELVVV
ncbi:MAG: insulinase family protein [Sediminibacterium sp.]|nr:insulinase family protein [Sediminibacterium sp.]MBX9779622.1 insulinase family protein [Chitinophagaceae bacterium]